MRYPRLLFGLLLCASAGVAEVKLSVGLDGALVLYSEGPSMARSAGRPSHRPVPPDLGEWIETQSSRRRLDPELVRAVIEVESGYRPEAISHKGAMGLMQLMPETARALSVEDPFDPYESVAAGTAYLRSLLDRFDGRIELALAGYDAGPEVISCRDQLRKKLTWGFPVGLTPLQTWWGWQEARIPGITVRKRVSCRL